MASSTLKLLYGLEHALLLSIVLSQLLGVPLSHGLRNPVHIPGSVHLEKRAAKKRCTGGRRDSGASAGGVDVRVVKYYNFAVG